jgi:C4-dicarboxylate transporter, DcuC family
MEFAGIAALIVVGVAATLVLRGWDVRLVLLSAALVIGVAAGDVARVVREFFATFSNEKFVVPICSAMGFAHVLRHTGCERHLVLLLVKPLRYVRALLVPGVIAIGFLVNIPVISQTSTAVCIGPVVVPLMRAAGYSFPTVGACLLLGASVGGELLNPGAPELLTIFDKTGVSTTLQAGQYLPPLVLTQFVVSLLVFWAMSVWWEQKEQQHGIGSAAEGPMSQSNEVESSSLGTRVNLLKAFVPLVPLALLFSAGPPLNLFEVPQKWVAPRPAELTSAAVTGFPASIAMEAKKHPAYSSRLIGLAMLVGVAVSMAVTPTRSRECVKHFFEGAGYGFTHIVSLIVTANCFGKSIEAAGLADALGRLIADSPNLMQPLAALLPLSFAVVSGSGMASTQSLYGFFHGPALALGLDPVAVGALVSLGAAAGRTMSPVAAVVLMCATLTKTNPLTLAKRIAVPLLTGIAVVVILRLCGIL